ncbi:2-hydroxy-palmitic acid dioxygenase MPO1 [Kluyveromyces lactis]|uniref:KLLA0A05005p n=1 Tax=Kluyveromyces lactis (strain ATCC 8585 / CBS 2359 / DSM 70799 / NBRC 1267 / NRRL Y-1140 / WM37) TaxID=284590 RepID=Q6CXW9_KLULA|nr:uncharacterized protein KLLA0_A05005g [Kluyveromyces lactis]CAH02808.1 KLLA0A05005p [Kluyveromyces lactis]|eukprot:XP_451220.1 uncharacterized protein KLLA0_A05005g [Kluyveromyces lactis]
MSPSLLDLETQLAFYKAYHNNTGNVLIHSIFVPTILFTSMRILNDVKIWNGYTLTHLLALSFGLFYILLRVGTGILASLILALTCKFLNDGTIKMTQTTAWILFVISWIFQFIGHGVFEKRKPALLDNLVQSLVLAPYFILYELLFILGFMPELKKNLQARVDKELDRMRASK